MKKIIITLLMLILLVVPLVYSEDLNEVQWDYKGVQTLTFWERLKQSIGVTSGATIPSGCELKSHTTWVFDANGRTSLDSIGNKCSSGDYMALFNCGLSSKYSSSSKCNYGGSIREGYNPIKNVVLSSANRYIYFCYSCQATTIPTQKTFKGFCLDAQNICMYIDRTYTEQQQILSTYKSYGCIKPAFPNLYSTRTECESNRQKQITCYTDCTDGKYETKNVTATFCRDAGLRANSPSNCVSPTAKPCVYNGITYQPNQLLCYGSNVVKCMDGYILTTIEICKNECKDGQCVDGGTPSGKEVCCRTYEFWKGEEKAGYSYKLEDKCPIGLNVKEVDVSYCTGKKEPEEPPIIDEETEEGVPEEKAGIEKCSIPLGNYCKPTNQAGRDDSSSNNLCKTGWCQDIGGSGIFDISGGGRCAKVGTFSDGKVKSGYEPHPDCVEEAKTYETNWCGWTSWSPDWFGTQCSTAYGIVIGGLVLLFILFQLGGGKK